MGSPLVAVVADDDPDITDLIDVVLSSVGLRVVHAADGAEAIAAVREHAPAITTIDLGMPGVDGLSALKRVREFSATYLIVVSSRSADEDVIAAFEAGADDYLVKPFSPKELQLRAEAMLRRAAAAPRTPPAAEEGWAVAAAREFRESLGRSQATEPAVTADPGAPVYDALREEEPGVPATPTPPPTATPTSPTAPTSPADPSPAAPTPAAPAAAAPVDPPLVSWQGDVARLGTLLVDTRGGHVELAGRRVDVPAEELDLLVALLRTGRRVRSRADLVLAMRGHAGATSHFVNEADKRAVDEHVASLQRRLGDDPAHPRLIETVRGVGFRLALPSD